MAHVMGPEEQVGPTGFRRCKVRPDSSASFPSQRQCPILPLGVCWCLLPALCFPSHGKLRDKPEPSLEERVYENKALLLP